MEALAHWGGGGGAPKTNKNCNNIQQASFSYTPGYGMIKKKHVAILQKNKTLFSQ
jgi:hypothetical protein